MNTRLRIASALLPIHWKLFSAVGGPPKFILDSSINHPRFITQWSYEYRNITLMASTRRSDAIQNSLLYLAFSIDRASKQKITSKVGAHG
jgi:hypothetical protein